MRIITCSICHFWNIFARLSATACEIPIHETGTFHLNGFSRHFKSFIPGKNVLTNSFSVTSLSHIHYQPHFEFAILFSLKHCNIQSIAGASSTLSIAKPTTFVSSRDESSTTKSYTDSLNWVKHYVALMWRISG